MKSSWITVTVLVLVVGSALLTVQARQNSPQPPAASQPAPFPTLEGRVSYALGVNIGNNLKRLQEEGVSLDTEIMLQALNDVLAGRAPKMDQAQCQQAMTDLSRKRSDLRQAKREAEGKVALEKGKKFLEANGKRPEVTTLPSGLQYEILATGEGDSPAATDEVTVHYRGTYIDGREFDSSYKRDKPTTFQLNRVIKGWTEALQLMKVGSKWKLFIPGDLAYGTAGKGEIGPNEALIFEVELIDVKPAGK